MVDVVFSNQFYIYSILLFLLSFIFALIIIKKSKTFPPSIFLFTFFLSVPVVGSFGYSVYESVYGSFTDSHITTFDYPIFVWALGTATFLAGILFSYFIIPLSKRNYIVFWDLKRLSFLLWFTIGISLMFTFIVLVRIGYIPLLRSNIDSVRGYYLSISGDWPMKLSKLWLVAASISSMLFFLKHRKNLYLLITLLSSFSLLVYGQRIYLFLAIVSFILIYYKFYRPKINHIIFVILAVILFALYAGFRGGQLYTHNALLEILPISLFGEWREYTYVVNEVRATGDFFKEEIFLGAFTPILPKQIWAVFAIDKMHLIHEYSAPYVFGQKFGNYMGIRIGTIGEAYAGYGLFYGVCLHLFLFGLIFGLLEKIYFKMNRQDARLNLVCFLISLLMYLPIATLYVTIACLVYFGFFFVLCLIIGSNILWSLLKKSRTLEV